MSDIAYDMMVALVSDQRMQNIIPLYQEGLDVKRLVLLVSTSGKKRNLHYLATATAIASALEADGQLSPHLQVSIAEKGIDPFDIEAAQETIEEMLPGQYSPERILVNITGGTKPMSIAAYAAARRKGVTSIYLDSGGERLIWLQPDGSVTSQKLKIGQISVQMALVAHGRTIDWNQTEARQAAEKCIAFIRALDGSFGGLKRMIPHISHLIRSGSGSPGWPKVFAASKLQINRDVRDALTATSFFEMADDTITVPRKSWRFLESGQWLETYVHIMLRDSGKFDDVQANVCLAGLENELDIICTVNGKLGLLECKSGRAVEKQYTSGDFQAILHRARVLKDALGGVFAQTFLISPLTQAKVAESLQERAEEYGIHIITSGQLRYVATIVYQRLSAG